MVDNPNPKECWTSIARRPPQARPCPIEAGSRALGVPRNVLSNWVNGAILPKHAKRPRVNSAAPRPHHGMDILGRRPAVPARSLVSW